MATKFSDLLGDSLLAAKADGESEAYRQVPTSELENKVVGIYFSAHWCGPCRNFTPKLVECYTKVQSELHDRFEIVFVSSDKDEESFKEYFQTMPWKAIPFSDQARARKLGEKFNVDGIPALIVLLPNGAILTCDGREDIVKKGEEAIRLWSQDESKLPIPPDEYVWQGVFCDGCKMDPLVGQRYVCSTCKEFDLCAACQKKGHEHTLTYMSQPLATIGILVWKGINLNS
ncbi:unnamed protein product [Rotaria sp. Silwood2]|nr:unnamed protein product [Rotaria sp. Silwood2]CAF2807570.1 unnamed protein product [Rotaria sp. Silwood2]CAF3086289.1 unnamed protein product [Rotaria sp. Silwood2]CAF3192283.1 unnamed protein product [Rotaria sp. Silwood2]CAF4121617.1 unnamed protein product [Rotaria sp. Silwood2]